MRRLIQRRTEVSFISHSVAASASCQDPSHACRMTCVDGVDEFRANHDPDGANEHATCKDTACSCNTGFVDQRAEEIATSCDADQNSNQPRNCATDARYKGDVSPSNDMDMFGWAYFGAAVVLALLVLRELLGQFGHSAAVRTHRIGSSLLAHWILLVILALVSMCGQTQALCSGTTHLTANTGTITDGSGPGPYANNMACTWVIAPPSAIGGEIWLTFSEFSLEMDYDYVRLYDCYESSTCIPVQLTGSEAQGGSWFSTNGLFRVVFTTDGSDVSSGFSASWIVQIGTNRDECASNKNNCDSNAACSDTEASFTCACNTGFLDWSAGGDGTSCDENQCTDGTHDCSADATCLDTEASFTCACNAGFESSDGGVVCVMGVDECLADQDNCDELATCTNTIGSFKCECNNGWTSSDEGVTDARYVGPGTVCEEFDGCEEIAHHCDVHSSCTTTDRGYFCSCNLGFTGTGTACTDDDECKMHQEPCTPVQCVNTAGSYECICEPGYEWTGRCTACGTGMYRDGDGQADCQPCTKPDGAVFIQSTGLASDSCPFECSPGFGEHPSCLPCGTGFFSSGPGGCKPCSTGPMPERTQFRKSSAVTAADECPYECSPGYTGTFCVACEPGHYKDQGGSSSCSVCSKPSNSEFVDSSALAVDACPYACDAGYGGERCEPCGTGTYKADRGIEECWPCSKKPAHAQFRPSSALETDSCSFDCYSGYVGSLCGVCSAGFFLSESEFCISCPPGSSLKPASDECEIREGQTVQVEGGAFLQASLEEGALDITSPGSGVSLFLWCRPTWHLSESTPGLGQESTVAVLGTSAWPDQVVMGLHSTETIFLRAFGTELNHTDPGLRVGVWMSLGAVIHMIAEADQPRRIMISLFLNGERVGKAALSTASVPSSWVAELTLGTNPADASAAFTGQLDDVQLYGSKLTESQMADLFLGREVGSEVRLVIAQNFDLNEGTGSGAGMFTSHNAVFVGQQFDTIGCTAYIHHDDLCSDSLIHVSFCTNFMYAVRHGSGPPCVGEACKIPEAIRSASHLIYVVNMVDMILEVVETAFSVLEAKASNPGRLLKLYTVRFAVQACEVGLDVWELVSVRGIGNNIEKFAEHRCISRDYDSVLYDLKNSAQTMNVLAPVQTVVGILELVGLLVLLYTVYHSSGAAQHSRGTRTRRMASLASMNSLDSAPPTPEAQRMQPPTPVPHLHFAPPPQQAAAPAPYLPNAARSPPLNPSNRRGLYPPVPVSGFNFGWPSDSDDPYEQQQQQQATPNRQEVSSSLAVSQARREAEADTASAAAAKSRHLEAPASPVPVSGCNFGWPSNSNISNQQQQQQQQQQQAPPNRQEISSSLAVSGFSPGRRRSLVSNASSQPISRASSAESAAPPQRPAQKPPLWFRALSISTCVVAFVHCAVSAFDFFVLSVSLKNDALEVLDSAKEASQIWCWEPQCWSSPLCPEDRFRECFEQQTAGSATVSPCLQVLLLVPCTILTILSPQR